MNQPSIGKIVKWISCGDRNNGFAPAIVTDVTHNSIRCNVFLPGVNQVRATDWCRHIDDPWNADHKFARDTNGAWDWMDPMDAGLTDEEIVESPTLSELIDQMPQEPYTPNVLPEIGRKARRKAAAAN